MRQVQDRFNLRQITIGYGMIEAIDDDGWMHSGDLATMDERGYEVVPVF